MIERPRRISRETLPSELAIFPLPGALLLPGGRLPLNIFEPRYLNMIEDALASRRLLGMIQPFAEKDERLLADDVRLYNVGCVGRIRQFSETEDGRYVITLEGEIRFRVSEELPMRDGYRRIRPDFSDYLGDLQEAGRDTASLDERDGLLDVMARYFKLKEITTDPKAIEGVSDEVLVNSLAMSCPFAPGEKQALLECADTNARGRLLIDMFEFALVEGAGPAPEARQ